MTGSKWWAESEELAVRLTGHAQQLLPFPRIGQGHPSSLTTQLRMGEHQDNGRDPNQILL
jgi:hypothetical protein